MNKNFEKDFFKLYGKLVNNEHFAFSKYADGELRILQGLSIDLLSKANGEFKYAPNSGDEAYRTALTESFTYQHKDYFVGIGCLCCVGQKDFEWMRTASKQPEINLTWANIFVNSNYPKFQEYFIPEFSHKEVILVCNKKATFDDLPFKLIKDFRVSQNAWKENYELVNNLKAYISTNDTSGKVFLFAAGPFGNILAHQLHAHNQDNTYIDIGSTLDPYLGLGRHRGYLRGTNTLRKVCTWD